MDSFSTLFFFSKSEETVIQAPINEEIGGGGSNGYCVVSREVVEVPVNEETSGGGSNGYCIVA
jgi:hypothetical protein